MSSVTGVAKITGASGLTEKVHKIQPGKRSITTCGIDLFRQLVDCRKTWRGVTCKNCRRRKDAT